MATKAFVLNVLDADPVLFYIAFAGSFNVLAQAVVVYRYQDALKQVRAEITKKIVENPGSDFSFDLRNRIYWAKDKAYEESALCTFGSFFSPGIVLGTLFTLPIWLPAGLVYAGIRLGGAKA